METRQRKTTWAGLELRATALPKGSRVIMLPQRGNQLLYIGQDNCLDLDHVSNPAHCFGFRQYIPFKVMITFDFGFTVRICFR